MRVLERQEREKLMQVNSGIGVPLTQTYIRTDCGRKGEEALHARAHSHTKRCTRTRIFIWGKRYTPYTEGPTEGEEAMHTHTHIHMG